MTKGSISFSLSAYYDAGKNRYFPYKGPIPDSSSKLPSLPPLSEPKQVLPNMLYANKPKKCCTRHRQFDICHLAEKRGKLYYYFNSKFQADIIYEHIRMRNSELNKVRELIQIWTCEGTNKMGNIALEHAVVDVTLLCGLMKRDNGGINGLLCFFFKLERLEHDILYGHSILINLQDTKIC